MKIRLAKVSDIELISEIFKLIDIQESKESDKEKIKKGINEGVVFVLEDDFGKVRGALKIDIACFCLEIVNISSNIKGGGTQLIQFCKQICKEKKLSKLWAWSQAEFNAEGFYAKMGFEERYLLKKHGYGKDCWIFGKVIDI